MSIHFSGDIAVHPYISQEPDLNYPLCLVDNIRDLEGFQREVLSIQRNGLDLLIGDDVSGRVPTLLAHEFLRLAEAGGHIDRAPDTFFMTSGHLPEVSSLQKLEKLRAGWSQNLQDRAAKIVGAVGTAQRAVIVTEVMATGRSVRRIQEAFRPYGITAIPVVSGTSYLNGHGSQCPDRPVVGVEKHAPEPISRLHVHREPARVAALRHFLHDYARILYTRIYNEPAPDRFQAAGATRARLDLSFFVDSAPVIVSKPTGVSEPAPPITRIAPPSKLARAWDSLASGPVVWVKKSGR